MFDYESEKLIELHRRVPISTPNSIPEGRPTGSLSCLPRRVTATALTPRQAEANR